MALIDEISCTQFYMVVGALDTQSAHLKILINVEVQVRNVR